MAGENWVVHVAVVVVNRAKLFDTINGVGIKILQGGFGSASNINSLNVEMDNFDKSYNHWYNNWSKLEWQK